MWDQNIEGVFSLVTTGGQELELVTKLGVRFSVSAEPTDRYTLTKQNNKESDTWKKRLSNVFSARESGKRAHCLGRSLSDCPYHWGIVNMSQKGANSRVLRGS